MINKQKDITTLLLQWFYTVKRDLPWRRTKDPYNIWLSEVMLQQTQVETVIDYYYRFIEKYPTIYHLAKADEDEVYKVWQGLGYYSRAKRLIQCAKIIVENYHGDFPKEYKKVLNLPGIGPYTAGAILSIAYNKKVAAVDGNVFRVIGRLYMIKEDITKPKTRKLFETKVNELLKVTDHAGDFNQGLMELGATVCTPTKPKCEICPMIRYCEAKKAGKVEAFPVKTKAMKQKKLNMEVAWVTYDKEVMIEKRPIEGLLGGMWGLPIVEANKALASGLSIVKHLEETYDLEVIGIEPLKQAKHIFTHRIWQMQLYHIEVKTKTFTEYPLVHWIHKDKLNQYPIPTAFKKLY